MALDNTRIIDLYRRRARDYDLTSKIYRLLGFREGHYRKLAIRALRLSPGDTVVDLGCGTGLNFPDLRAQVGPAGRQPRIPAARSGHQRDAGAARRHVSAPAPLHR